MKIVAIGGPEHKEAAIRDALEFSPVERNSVLIIPSACSRQDVYDKRVPATINLFARLGLGADIQILHKFGEMPGNDELLTRLGSASLIHNIGGNTPHMFRQFARNGLGDALAERLHAPDVMSTGVSAGALYPFEQIHSNPAAKPKSTDWDYVVLNGLPNVLRGVATAHADMRDESLHGLRPDTRLEHLSTHFPEGQTLGLGIDCDAAVILGDTPHIIRMTPGAQVHVLNRVDSGDITVTPVEDAEQLRPFAA